MIHVDGYSDLRRIGQGGLGDVYRATRVSTGSTVAIKVLRDVSDESVAWHRTRRELTALVALAGHANVIQLLELLDLPEGPALVMEFAPGGSVGDLMRHRDATLSVGEVVLVGRHIAAALAAAHEQGIVHRDIKPQNLLIDAYGQVKLCDFGVAALTRSDDFQTRTNALSMRYASPEDLDNEIEVGPPSDVYSLGATLLHLARGAPPTLKERLAPWVAPTTDDPELAALDAVISACLHPTPSDRPTAGALLDRLEQLEWSLGGRCRALLVDVAAIPDVAASAAEHDLAPVPEPGPALHDVVDDTTMARGDRPATPVGQAGASEPRRRRGRVVAGGFAALAAVGVAAALFWPGGDEAANDGVDTRPPTTAPAITEPAATVPEVPTSSGADASNDAVSIESRPPGLDPIDDDTVVWPFGEPGECLVQEAGVDELASVDCDVPHDLQRYAVAELDSAEFPGSAAFDASAATESVAAACRAAFEPFVGIAYDDSVFDTPFTMPSAATWADGDRRYQCLIGVAGSRIVGDAAGAER